MSVFFRFLEGGVDLVLWCVFCVVQMPGVLYGKGVGVCVFS